MCSSDLPFPVDSRLVEEAKRDLYARAGAAPNKHVHVRIERRTPVRRLVLSPTVPGFGWAALDGETALTAEIGLMKALGAGSGTVGFLLAAEQLLLALVGGGIGYALGIILARLLGQKIFGAAPEPSLIVFLVVIALAAGVTLLGSALPLRRASRYQPAPILRGE